MRALKVQPGDEVITTAHSWISTAAMITHSGATVVFCDTDDATFTIDPAAIEAAITPRTVGIIRCTCTASRPTWMRSWRSRTSTSFG